MPGRKLRGRAQRVVLVLDAVMLLVAGFEAAQDVHGVLYGRFADVDLLETARQRMILFEDSAVFVVGGRTDAAQVAVGQGRLDQVRGIHHAARRCAGADDGVNFVDEEDRARLLLDLREHGLQALLEIAPVLGAGDERAHVEGIDGRIQKHVGHLVFDDHAGEALGDRRLADAGFAHVQRIVLASAAQDLDGALDLELAPDQGVDLALARRFIEIRRIFLQGIAAPVALALGVGGGAAFLALAALLAAGLREAVRDEIDHIQTRHVLHAEEVCGVRLLLAEYRHQHIGHGDLFLAARLDVKHGPLQHSLEPQGRLHVTVLAGRQSRRGLVDELLQLGLELCGISAAGLQDLPDFGGIHDGEQQMLDGHEFMPRLARTGKRIIQAKFEFLT